jgi:hypothetical protein
MLKLAPPGNNTAKLIAHENTLNRMNGTAEG